MYNFFITMMGRPDLRYIRRDYVDNSIKQTIKDRDILIIDLVDKLNKLEDDIERLKCIPLFSVGNYIEFKDDFCIDGIKPAHKYKVLDVVKHKTKIFTGLGPRSTKEYTPVYKIFFNGKIRVISEKYIKR